MVVILMGVAGAGKTTIGRLLADELGWLYRDADDLHPPANIAKMAEERPLDDSDRQPWLDEVERLVLDLVDRGISAVLSCSALKQRYRDQLTVSDDVRWVYLTGAREVLARRLTDRKGHFLSASLLESQLRDLEEPGPEVIRIDVELRPLHIVEVLRGRLEV